MPVCELVRTVHSLPYNISREALGLTSAPSLAIALGADFPEAHDNDVTLTAGYWEGQAPGLCFCISLVLMLRLSSCPKLPLPTSRCPPKRSPVFLHADRKSQVHTDLAFLPPSSLDLHPRLCLPLPPHGSVFHLAPASSQGSLLSACPPSHVYTAPICNGWI